jgi:hypothetical protein
VKIRVLQSQANELANFAPPYQMVIDSTPPIPPRGMGVPRCPVPDYYFNKYGVPDRIPRTGPRRGPVNSFEKCLAMVREDFKKQMWETFGVELSKKSCIYQKPYPSHFDMVLYPKGMAHS